eukprot:UN00875
MYIPTKPHTNFFPAIHTKHQNIIILLYSLIMITMMFFPHLRLLTDSQNYIHTNMNILVIAFYRTKTNLVLLLNDNTGNNNNNTNATLFHPLHRKAIVLLL